MKKSTCYVVFFYSLILIALGIKGYIKGSSASLYMGTGLGFLVFLSSIGLFFQKKFALYSATFLTGALSIVFFIRCIKTGGGSLPGTMAVLSAVLLGYLLKSFKSF